MNNSVLPGSGLTATFLSFVLAMSTVAQSPNQSVPPALRLVESKRPLVIAHRGYCQFAPENTLPAFQLALQSGADLVELDYHHSKDGIPVVIHDFELDRTTDAVRRLGGEKIAVSSKSAAELATLDAGGWFAPGFTGIKLPTLDEAVDLIQTNGGVTLIERKAGDAATCAKMLTEKKLINQVVVQAFDWQYLQALHQLQPDQVLGALGPAKTLADGRKADQRGKLLDESWLDLLQPTGARIVVWSKEINADAVKLAHQRGLKVWVYTINEPALAEALLDMGVDGLITNNPSLIWRTMALRKPL